MYVIIYDVFVHEKNTCLAITLVLKDGDTFIKVFSMSKIGFRKKSLILCFLLCQVGFLRVRAVSKFAAIVKMLNFTFYEFVFFQHSFTLCCGFIFRFLSFSFFFLGISRPHGKMLFFCSALLDL